MADAADDAKLDDEFVFDADEGDEVKTAGDEDEDLSDFFSDSDNDADEGAAGGDDSKEEIVPELETVEGEEFMAVKPWLGAIREPTGFTPPGDGAEVPDVSLELTRAFGYRCRGVFNNVHFSASGELVYPAAAVGVVANPKDNSQRFYQGHVDDIISLAVDPAGALAASGGKATHVVKGRRQLPAIHIWDIATCERIALIQGLHKRAVTAVAFSPDSSMVVSVGQDNNHTMAVHEVATGRLINKVKTGTDPIFSVAWSATSGYITTTGVKHCSFWQFRGGAFGRQGKALYGSKGSRCTQLSQGETSSGRLWTGTAQGELFLFKGNKVAKVMKGHKGHVTAMAGGPEYMASGGQDGKISFWSFRSESLGVLDIGAQPRALEFGPSGTLAVGTAHGEVVLVTLGSAEAPAEGATTTVITSGHFDGETWALASNPDGNIALTGGDDNTIQLWNLDDNAVLKTRLVSTKAKKKTRTRRRKTRGRSTMADSSPEQCCRAADWGPAGFIVIGTNDGRIQILDESDLSTVSEVQVSKEPITVVKFDPLGDYVAVGSVDSRAYIYSCTDGALDPVSVCKGNSSAISHIDWDADGVAIQTNSTAYELLFYMADSGEQETGGATLFRDTEWATWSCTLGWPVQGIWYKFSKGSDINTVDRNPDGDLLAVGDDRGRIRLFKYPCYDKAAQSSTFRGHASHLTALKFLPDGETLLSVGGNDNTLLRWRIA